MHGGVCSDALAGYSCSCASGFIGDICETGTSNSFFCVFFVFLA